MGDKGLDAYLNQQVKTLGKAVDDIYSGKTPFKGYVPSGPQDYVNPTYAIKNLIVGNQPGIPPSKQPQKAYDFETEAFAIGEYLGGKADQARSKDRYAQIHNYNTDPNGGFNYDKYRSAYDSDEEFDKAGYHPLRDDNEEKYNEKLKENRLETFYFFGLLIIILIPLIIIFVIVINKKNKRLDQIFVEEMKSINKKIKG